MKKPVAVKEKLDPRERESYEEEVQRWIAVSKQTKLERDKLAEENRELRWRLMTMDQQVDALLWALRLAQIATRDAQTKLRTQKDWVGLAV